MTNKKNSSKLPDSHDESFPRISELVSIVPFYGIHNGYFEGNSANLKNKVITDYGISSCFVKNGRISDTIFRNLDIDDSTFYYTSFERCRFENVSFRKSDYVNCTFQDCTIAQGSNLSRASFDNTNMKNCSFIDSSLNNADFYRCNLINTILSDCSLCLTTISETKIKNLTTSNLFFSEQAPLKITKLQSNLDQYIETFDNYTRITNSVDFNKFIKENLES